MGFRCEFEEDEEEFSGFFAELPELLELVVAPLAAPPVDEDEEVVVVVAVAEAATVPFPPEVSLFAAVEELEEEFEEEFPPFGALNSVLAFSTLIMRPCSSVLCRCSTHLSASSAACIVT